MRDVLVWLSVWAVGMLAIFGYRWHPKRRNRRKKNFLPPPSPVCRRNSTESVP